VKFCALIVIKVTASLELLISLWTLLISFICPQGIYQSKHFVQVQDKETSATVLVFLSHISSLKCWTISCQHLSSGSFISFHISRFPSMYFEIHYSSNNPFLSTHLLKIIFILTMNSSDLSASSQMWLFLSVTHDMHFK
jgi:hypothetical protein